MGRFKELLKYTTPKYVVIRDWRVAVMNYSLKAGIALYIVIYTIGYKCAHLVPHDVVGSARVSLQHPTSGCNPLKRDCDSDWTPLTDLPYCTQYEESADGRAMNTKRGHCDYFDGIELSPFIPVPGALFVPTRYDEIPQKRGCLYTKETGYRCKAPANKYVFDDVLRGSASRYCADIERFTLLLTHSFHALGEGRVRQFEGSGGDFDGRLEPTLSGGGAGEVLPIPTNNLERLGQFPSALTISLGDIISVEDLLKLADPRGAELLDVIRPKNTTMRWDGGAMVVSIQYKNIRLWDPFATSPVTYTISVEMLAMKEFKVMSQRKTDVGRVIHNIHGLLVLVDVGGQLFTLATQRLLAVLTTSMALLAVAGLITDFTICYLLDLRRKYRILKYQPSQQFDKLRKVVREFEGLHCDSARYKVMPHASLLQECVLHPCRVLSRDELLTILVKFEQRLNRLDGMDEYNADLKQADAVGQYIDRQEREFWYSEERRLLELEGGSDGGGSSKELLS